VKSLTTKFPSAEHIESQISPIWEIAYQIYKHIRFINKSSKGRRRGEAKEEEKER